MICDDDVVVYDVGVRAESIENIIANICFEFEIGWKCVQMECARHVCVRWHVSNIIEHLMCLPQHTLSFISSNLLYVAGFAFGRSADNGFFCAVFNVWKSINFIAEEFPFKILISEKTLKKSKEYKSMAIFIFMPYVMPPGLNKRPGEH